MLFYKTKNEKIRQSIWIFVIHMKSIEQILKNVLDTAAKTGLDASKKLVHKTESL